MEQTPGNLSLLGSDVWKGGATHNGSLLKIHDNSFTAGYSKLTPHATIPVQFGYGVWYDAYLQNNAITNVMPTGGTTVAKFAGIMARQPAIASGYPVSNKVVNEYNKGLIVKDGYVIYKTATASTEDDQKFANIQVGMYLQINNLNGRPRFSASRVITGYTLAGVVVLMNPDDSSWTVKVSSQITSGEAATLAEVAALITAAVAVDGAVQPTIDAAITAESAPTGIIGLAIASAVAVDGAVQPTIDAAITAECAPTGTIGLAIAAAIAAIP